MWNNSTKGHASMSSAVIAYRLNSTTYKEFVKAVRKANPEDGSDAAKTVDILNVNSLNKATTFAQMIEIAESYSLEEDPLITQWGIKTMCFFGGYVINEANIAYYASQLKGDITDYAVETGFYEKPVQLEVG